MSNEVYKPSQRDDRPLRTIDGGIGRIWTMAYLPGGQRLVTGSSDKTIRIWTAGDGRQEGNSMFHKAGVRDLAVTSDGRRIVSADDEGNIRVWDVATQDLVSGWGPGMGPGIAVSTDGRLLAYGSRTIIVKRLKGLGRIKQKIKIDSLRSALCFSRDGSKLAIGSLTDIFIYDVESGQQILTLEGHENWVTSLQWSRDGSKLYSASDDCTIRCWNTATGQQSGRPWTGHTDSINSLSLSQHGTKLASGSDDRTIRFWDTSGHLIGHPLEYTHPVLEVCISPSNDVVAAAGGYGLISIWRVPWRSDENQSSEPTPLPIPPISPDITTTTAYPTIRTQPREPSPNTETKRDLYSFPAPLDLTRDIIRLDDQFSEVGGFGDVHKCIYNSASGAEEVAVKAFRFIFTLEEGGTKLAKMVRRELGIWKRLEHPNIVPFLGIATGFGLKGSTSIVSLWMSNGSLHQFLDSHGDELGVAHRLHMLSDVANGLAYLHSFSDTPVIHGDLNCNNVLVDANFTARLADFGLSSFVGHIPQGLTYLGGATTRPGTLRWTSPEQLDEGYERAPQSDIYSFGCISLQVFSGQPPWSDVREDAGVILRLARGQNPQRPISRAMENCHWEFIESCWRSVEERPTAMMLVSSLQELLSSCPPSKPLREMFPPPPSQIDLTPEGSISLGHSIDSRESAANTDRTGSSSGRRESESKFKFSSLFTRGHNK